MYWGEEFGWTSYLRPRLFGGRMAPSLIVFLLTGQLLGSGDDGLGMVGVTLLTMIPLAGLSLWIARRPNRAVACESPQ